ncbi:hypothetical protein SK128_006114 [Halocaridina rubra]|uniref:Uncharacterized protein n=1 Tax=Halocaridina rubra TaxID=373956 RepID=A0AAN8WS09_HALRR
MDMNALVSKADAIVHVSTASCRIQPTCTVAIKHEVDVAAATNSLSKNTPPIVIEPSKTTSTQDRFATINPVSSTTPGIVISLALIPKNVLVPTTVTPYSLTFILAYVKAPLTSTDVLTNHCFLVDVANKLQVNMEVIHRHAQMRSQCPRNPAHQPKGQPS